MSRGPRDPVDAGAPWPTRTGPGCVCGAWAKGLGAGPETLRGRDPAGGVRVGRRRPARHHHRGGPAHRGAGVGVRAGRGRGARSGGARRLAPWRRSVSARRADPPTASTSAREELRGPCRICTALTESGRQA